MWVRVRAVTEPISAAPTWDHFTCRLSKPNHHGDIAFEFAVRCGVPQHHWRFGPMPPVEGLSEEDIESIMAFVREQQRIEGFEPYPP